MRNWAPLSLRSYFNLITPGLFKIPDLLDNYKMQIDLSLRTLHEWQELLKNSSSANWMQTWAYAQASLKKDFIPSRMATVNDDQNQVIALFAFQRIKLGPFQYVRINRGPLWLHRKPTEDDLLNFAKALRQHFPKSFFSRIKWLAEFEPTPQGYEKLSELQFQLTTQKFETSWVNLKIPQDQLRKKLRQKWRNSLNKFEKSDVVIRVDSSLDHLDPFLNFYELYKKQKNYKGPTRDFLRIELANAFRQKEATLFWALQDGLPIAGLAIHHHGKNVSYRASFNSEQGKITNAHYGLIWKVITHYQTLGFERFDLGGLLPDEADGLTHFKMGLNGEYQKSPILIG